MKQENLDDNEFNVIYYHSSKKMKEIKDNSIDLIITSPPYFNIKDYSKDGYQEKKHSRLVRGNVGDISDFKKYISSLLMVWKECYRVLKPNGKLCINVPLMPILKRDLNTHYNRHIYDLQSSIQGSILKNTSFFLLDIYIWNRTNSTKKLMFGSYPYPSNFYAQNTIEFITVYVKDGIPNRSVDNGVKEESKLSQQEWIEYTKQIWNIPIPNKKDIAFGKHSAIMPEEIVNRLIKLYSFVGDVVLDPFAGSGTTLKKAYELKRKYVGYEIYKHYEQIIEAKLKSVEIEETSYNEKK
ncbi:site-specific DNA-methyltransferase [Mycoplasma feriruminatoris]|uniref:DNA-methyltransferase n=1 Tax=Mycoplasma feriruminatoris TaxID=1179777 RepID=UPI00241E3474|nr:site-specific DNA-methyltransferase [Mycoplasma feriruminatoris]WFQ90864.1 site-specific DNA-methyltransferase [Mycoplasma feriruminatoris]